MCDLRFPRLNNKGLCKPRRVTKMVKKEIIFYDIWNFYSEKIKDNKLFIQNNVQRKIDFYSAFRNSTTKSN